MTHEQRMEEAIRRAHEQGYISTEILNQLPSVQQLVISIVVVGGVLVGAAFGIMVGAAYGPGSPDKVTTSTAGFCSMLALAGVAALCFHKPLHK